MTQTKREDDEHISSGKTRLAHRCSHGNHCIFGETFAGGSNRNTRCDDCMREDGGKGIVAECWTCGGLLRAPGTPKVAGLSLWKESQARTHRAAGHDVREVKP